MTGIIENRKEQHSEGQRLRTFLLLQTPFLVDTRILVDAPYILNYISSTGLNTQETLKQKKKKNAL